MPISPNSFSMTAMRLPWFAVRMRLRRVVLPAPRKPVRTVTGTRVSEGVAMLFWRHFYPYRKRMPTGG